MWPNSRPYQPQPQPTATNMDSIAMTANSLRHLFGDNINQNLLNSMRDSQSDAGMAPMAAQRASAARHVIDYESNTHYSRLDRNLMNQRPQAMDNSDPYRTESRVYDPKKMPQKSILKKSKNDSFEHLNSRSVEDEDIYIYGDSAPLSYPTGGHMSAGLPPGIVSIEQQNERNCAEVERDLSPISLRLKREMEKMDRSRMNEAKGDRQWSSRVGGMAAENPINPRDEWTADGELYQRRYRQLSDPSPERVDSLALEKVRIQQMAAIQAGILANNKQSKRSPQRGSVRASNRRPISPESSPKRMRRRSPSVSPRRRTLSPRRRSVSPRNRSRNRSRSPVRGRYQSSRSRSIERNRSRRRSRSPERRRTSRSPDPMTNRMDLMDQNLLNPMTPIIPIPAQGYDLPFMPTPHLMSANPMITGLMNSMINPFPPVMHTNMQRIAPNPVSKQPNRSVLKDVPIARNSVQSSAKKDLPKKEDKLLNPYDLLLAERSKLREEMNVLKKQYERKVDEQTLILAKDKGKDSYAYKQLDKVIKDIQTTIESINQKITKNMEVIQEVQNSKAKAKEFVEKLKITRDITKVQLKKKVTPQKPKTSKPLPAKSSPQKPKEEKKAEKEVAKPVAKPNSKNVEEEEEEDEKNSRFHYFDSGPHWCQCCDKFADNMKQYFNHIHSRDHLSKQKESERSPWITKDYIKQNERQSTKSKDNKLVVPAKGIQFIQPMEGFYCELCKQFLHDCHQTERHFKTAKHNRNYTRYTLEHNDYENRWKTERDKAFTELKRREREAEKEKIRQEAEEKANKRKKLEEEVKRKDKAVKERIENMNKSLKIIKELDEPKAGEEKTEPKGNTPLKNIKLNLSSKAGDSNTKPKAGDKSEDKVAKSGNETPVKSKKTGKAEEVKQNKPKISEKQNSEDINDMLIIDEINCDSEDVDMEHKDSDETIDEIKLLYPENSEGTEESVHKLDENMPEIRDNCDEIIGNTPEVSKPVEVTEDKAIPEGDRTVDTVRVEDNEEVVGVLPEVDSKADDKSVSDEKTEPNIGLDDRVVDNGVVANVENKSDNSSTVDEKVVTNPKSGVNSVNNKSKSYAEAVAKGSVVLESNKNVVKEANSGSKAVTNDNKPSDSVDKNGVKSDDILDIDSDIAKFTERLASMVKNEAPEPDGDYEDELEGFDVIDSVNDAQEIIDLSD